MHAPRETTEPIPSAPEHEPQHSLWLKYVDLATKLTALSVAASFCISIIFDYGFYFALDISLQELPTTINDHVKSCLMWLPMTLGPAIGYTFLELNSIKKSNSEKNEVRHLEKHLLESIRKNRHFPLPKWLKFAFYFSVLALPAALYIKLVLSEILFAFVICIPFFIILLTIIWRMFMHPQIYARGYHKYLRIALFLPSFVFFFFWLGYISGKITVSIKHHDYTVSTKDGRFKNTPASIIRTYDKYTFIGYSTQNLAFLPHTDLTLYEKKYRRANREVLGNAKFEDIIIALRLIFVN